MLKFSNFERLQRKIESCYGSVLLLQSSSISFFICILVYRLVRSTTDPDVFIYFTGFSFVALSKISIPHYFGQRVINANEDLVNVLYSLSWYQFNRLQRKSLLTLMICSQKHVKINVMGFYDLNLDSLGKVSKKWNF